MSFLHRLSHWFGFNSSFADIYGENGRIMSGERCAECGEVSDKKLLAPSYDDLQLSNLVADLPSAPQPGDTVDLDAVFKRLLSKSCLVNGCKEKLESDVMCKEHSGYKVKDVLDGRVMSKNNIEFTPEQVEQLDSILTAERIAALNNQDLVAEVCEAWETAGYNQCADDEGYPYPKDPQLREFCNERDLRLEKMRLELRQELLKRLENEN